jgi:homocysteine S-methyltransferase
VRFDEFLATGSFCLSEGSVYERLRRDPSISFDPFIAHGGLIYDPGAAPVLEQVHRDYLDVAQRYGLPIFILTDTWRASRERIANSGFSDRNVNLDNAVFLSRIRLSYGSTISPIFIGGLTGPKGDAYLPEEAPPRLEAERYHAPQVEALAGSGVDFLCACTLPSFAEAQGIAAAMAKTGLPYMLSFVVRREGTLLDGTPLDEVIETIDTTSPRPPAGYAVNCVHPEVFQDGLMILMDRKPALLERVLCFMANTSSKRPEELDNLAELETEEPERLSDLMVEVRGKFGTQLMGGCCGTSTDHIDCLARKVRASIG